MAPHPKTPLLRKIAFAGTIAVLVLDTREAFPLGRAQWASFLVLGLVACGTFFTLGVVLSRASRRIIRTPDLLVPLGVVILARNAVGWLAAVVPGLDTQKTIKIVTVTLSISSSFVVLVAVHIAYAAWMTALVVRSVREGDPDPARALEGLRRWFLRTAGLTAIGWAVNLALLALAVPFFAMAMPIGAALLSGATLVWNLLTVALLPVALDTRYGFWRGFLQGVRQSLRGLRSWVVPIVLQCILLGYVTLISVSTSGGGRYSHTTSWSVNPLWIGGYRHETKWHEKVGEALGFEPLALVSTVLALVLGVLAIAIKVHVVARIAEQETAIGKPEGGGVPA